MLFILCHVLKALIQNKLIKSNFLTKFDAFSVVLQGKRRKAFHSEDSQSSSESSSQYSSCEGESDKKYASRKRKRNSKSKHSKRKRKETKKERDTIETAGHGR